MTPPAKRSFWTILPVLGFVALALVFWKGLSGDPSRLPSTLIGKPVPDFILAPVKGIASPGFSSQDLANGKITLVNIFASWCGPCRQEHPLLMALSKRTDIQIMGINNKDAPEDSARFLNTLGNPYLAVGADSNGRVTIDWGGYGVPETFLVDGLGKIRYKVVGPLTDTIVTERLLPEIEKVKSEN